VPRVVQTGRRSSPRAAAGALCVCLALVGLGSRATHIPAVDAAPTAPTVVESPGAAALRRGEGLDVNRASAAELELLPAVGPSLAARIVADRASRGPFRTIDDLARVRGIGPRTIERLAPHIHVTPQPSR
jgi:competence protein ComEA